MGSGAAEHGDGRSDLADLAVGGTAVAAWPPVGWVTEVEAAKRMGISDATLRAWQRKGRFGYAGERVQAPDTRWWRLYAVAEVDRAHRAMRRDEGDPVDSTNAANVWPPAGFVDGYEVARLCGVNRRTIKVWARQGRVNGGRLAKKPGERARVTVFPEAEVRRLVEEVRAEAEAPFPPPGFVDRYQAATLFGVRANQFNIWLRQGRIRCTGRTVRGPGGGPAKIYAVAELERAREEMAAEDAAAEKPPEGFLDIEGAARFFDVHPVTLNGWQGEGLVKGTWHDRPGGRGRRRVYAIAELERARAQMAEEAARPTAPPGFIELHEAVRTLGVSVPTIYRWEKHGEMTAGQIVPIPGTSARTKIYPVAEIERLREEIRKAGESFPPAGWVEMKEAARRANVSAEVWKKWLTEGRVENWRWARRPTMARCKLFAVQEIERIVAEMGRDHHFFLEPDGHEGWRPPDGYVDRSGAAEMFGVAPRTISTWQTEGRITCGRWARVPVGAGRSEGGGRRVYPVEELWRLVEEFSRVGKPYVAPGDPSVARVPIMSWSNTRFEAIIDATDLPLIAGMRWNWMPRSDGEEAVVARSGPSGEQTPLRRIILGLKGRQWNISHRNGDALDCRRANLIVRDRTHTNAHARKRKVGFDGRPPTSQFKGVCWIEKAGKWLAQIQKEGVHRRLGYFGDEIAAAEAYDEAARELFGEHARLNFPDGIDDWLGRTAA